MRRLLQLIFGAVVAVIAGLSLISSSYAVSKAYQSGQTAELAGPVVFGLISLIVLFVGLRMAIRAIIPGFTFMKLMFLGLILIVVLHIGGYVSLSSDRVRSTADSVQRQMRSLLATIQERIPKAEP